MGGNVIYAYCYIAVWGRTIRACSEIATRSIDCASKSPTGCCRVAILGFSFCRLPFQKRLAGWNARVIAFCG